MPIQDYAAHPPGVETPGYRLKPVKTGSKDVAGLEHRIHARGLFKTMVNPLFSNPTHKSTGTELIVGIKLSLYFAHWLDRRPHRTPNIKSLFNVRIRC
jgi:hypothetical protein